jgi:hypothetical protein
VTAFVCLRRDVATGQIARGETSQFPCLVSPPLKRRSPRILADGFSDPLNCRFTFSILGFMLRFSYPPFVFQLAIRSGRWLLRSEIVVLVAPSLCVEDTEPLSSPDALFVRVNLISERNHIRNEALKSLPNCEIFVRAPTDSSHFIHLCMALRPLLDPGLPQKAPPFFSFRPLYGPDFDLASKRNENQEYFLRGKAAGA